MTDSAAARARFPLFRSKEIAALFQTCFSKFIANRNRLVISTRTRKVDLYFELLDEWRPVELAARKGNFDAAVTLVASLGSELHRSEMDLQVCHEIRRHVRWMRKAVKPLVVKAKALDCALSPLFGMQTVSRMRSSRWRLAREIAEAAMPGGKLKKTWDQRHNFYPPPKGKLGKQRHLYDPIELLQKAAQEGDIRTADIEPALKELGLSKPPTK